MVRVFVAYIQDSVKMLKLLVSKGLGEGTQFPFVVLSFLGALVMTGSIAFFAISSDYPGSIQFHLGPDGIQLQVNGKN
jgi:hypothetical protein